MSAPTPSPVDELRHAFRPGMTSGQAMVWVWGAAIGLGVWALGLLGAVGLRGAVSPWAGAAAWLGWSVAALAVPGAGVLRPGGARGPVILRAMPAVLLALDLAAVGLGWGDHDTWGASADQSEVIRGSAVLFIIASPLTAAALAWVVFSGRGALRTALLVAGAVLSCAAAAVVCATSSFTPWHAVAAILCVASLAALVWSLAMRRGLQAEGWIEVQAIDGTLRVGDDAWPMPEVFANYRGVVSVPRDALPPPSPGRGARPPNPAALFPCALSQLPWILRDLLDARLALALFFGTAAAASALLDLASR